MFKVKNFLKKSKKEKKKKNSANISMFYSILKPIFDRNQKFYEKRSCSSFS